jgi:mono/diheme cytochrome c family protein
LLILALGAGLGWILSAPRPLAALPQHTPDAANGEKLYHAGGCYSCHKAAEGAANQELPSGGRPLKTPIGTLYPPNITPDPATGIGNWSDLEFVNAVQRGIAPNGTHYIPALPYTSYARMRTEDVLDIKAYLGTLEAVSAPPVAQDIPLQFFVRRGLGLWKWLGLPRDQIENDASQSASWNRGRYLVNGPGHCGECHTPRTLFMTADTSRTFQGGPHPEGEGNVPSMVGLIERGRYKDANDLATALEFGEIMGYDKLSSGGMAAVQRNLAKLPKGDIAAIAEYLVSLKN